MLTSFFFLLFISFIIAQGPSRSKELPLVNCLSSVPSIDNQPLTEPNPVWQGVDVVEYQLRMEEVRELEGNQMIYHDNNPGRQGDSNIAANFRGFQFWFEKESHRSLFLSDPWKYAPRFGGFCTYGIAFEMNEEEGGTWPWTKDWMGPPCSPQDGWSVINGHLYCNIWDSYRNSFEADIQRYLDNAEARWKKFFGSLEAGPFNSLCYGNGPYGYWCMNEAVHWSSATQNGPGACADRLDVIDLLGELTEQNVTFVNGVALGEDGDPLLPIEGGDNPLNVVNGLVDGSETDGAGFPHIWIVVLSLLALLCVFLVTCVLASKVSAKRQAVQMT